MMLLYSIYSVGDTAWQCAQLQILMGQFFSDHAFENVCFFDKHCIYGWDLSMKLVNRNIRDTLCVRVLVNQI